MRRLKTVGLAVVAVLALGAMSAGAASAAKANLVLREGGEHVYEGLDPVIPAEAPVEVSFETELGGCATTSPVAAEMHENTLPTATVHISGSEEAVCRDEYEGKHDELAFYSGEVFMSSKGKVKFFGGMAITLWGPYGSEPECRYSFSLRKAKATFPVPPLGKAGEAVLKGSAKSEGRHANKACPKKEDPSFTMTLADNGGHPLETTLEG